MPVPSLRRAVRSFVAITLLIPCPLPLAAQQVDTAAYANLRFRAVGPEGNRAIAVVGVPGDRMVAFVGAASGGVWKTEDGGVNWRPTFDAMDAQSIGSLAIAPTATNEVWAGTGETFIIRPALAMGNGIYKSVDGGETWTHMGLEAVGRIGRVVVHPRDHDVVYACALGHAYDDQQERGVYRTRDGGRSWEHVLFADPGTGCSDLAIDPQRPDILFAGMWSLRVDPWRLASEGTGGGVYVSRDGGDTWKKLAGEGLPAADHAVGKVAVGIAYSDPDRVYALIEDDDPSFYRSDDGGRHWRLMTRNHDIAERSPYYTRFGIDTRDPDRVYFTSVRFSMSQDGGATLVTNPPRGGGDTHDVWVDPLDSDRFMVADDGGATITLNRGKSFQRVVLPIAQMYHVHTDNQIPYDVYGNRQDGYSYSGPSNSRSSGIVEGNWHSVGGCESGFAIPDTAGANEVWSGCYDGGLELYDPRTQQVRNVRIWPEASYGWPPADVRYRWHWTFPIVISPHDHNTVYVGSQHVHRTRDQGQSWEVISPDLTLNDKSMQQSSGGKTTDNLMTFDGSLLYALAESPVQQGVLWAGSNDGQIHVTRDGGETWENVSDNIRDLPEYGQVSNIEPSRWGAGTAYVRRRLPPDGLLRTLHLQDHRLRGDLGAHRRRHPPLALLLRARRARGPGAEGNALRRHGQRRLVHPGRRRTLAAAAQRPPGGSGVLAHHPAALRRPGGGHLRAWDLDPGRHHAAARAEPRGHGVGRPRLRRATRLPLPADPQRGVGPVQRVRTQPRLRGRHQPLALQRRGRTGQGGDPGRWRRGDPDAEPARRVGGQPHHVGPALRGPGRSAPAHAAARRCPGWRPARTGADACAPGTST